MDVAVTQGTNTTTAVTANGEVGIITCFTSVLATLTSIKFTVNNTGSDADSAIFLQIVDYSGTWVTNGIPIVSVENRVAGTSFDIRVTNVGANALGGILKIAFALQ